MRVLENIEARYLLGFFLLAMAILFGYHDIISHPPYSIHQWRQTDALSLTLNYFKEGLLIAAECVNRPQEFMLSKKVIAEGIMIHPKRLADESTRVKELIGSTL